MMVWPESVLILDPECGHELEWLPGADAHNNPRSAYQWCENEFRLPQYQGGSSRHSVDVMIGIWRYRYGCLVSYQSKYANTYSHYDLYNAAWVACGYTSDQSSKAIELCGQRFFPGQDL
jgi:hypothetical protein